MNGIDRPKSAERDATGKFLPGNKGSPGRKPRAAETNYLQAFRESVSSDDWQAVIERAVKDAKRGDRHARRFLADYLVGKPPQTVEIEGASVVLMMQLVEMLKALEVDPAAYFAAHMARLQEKLGGAS